MAIGRLGCSVLNDCYDSYVGRLLGIGFYIALDAHAPHSRDVKKRQKKGQDLAAQLQFTDAL